MAIALTIFLAIIIIVLVQLFKKSYSHWKNKNVPYFEPKFPFGNAENPITRKNPIGVNLKIYYTKFKSQGHKHGGMYLLNTPKYMPIEPEYIKNIIQRDFDHFTERGFYYNEKDDPLSANLFALGGHKWRNLRTKLTPTFTSGKMKMMFDTLLQCGCQMQDAVLNFCENRQAVDIKDVVACYTTDVIGSCAFGLECNSFKSPDAEFRKHGRKIFDPWTISESLRNAFSFSNPLIARRLGMRLFPKDSTEFFMKVVRDTLKFRETSNLIRKDMLQILIELRNELRKDGDESLTVEELAAQAFVFFIAGFETSSTTMSFCLYELAINPDIQEKLRREIKQTLAKHDGKVTYDGIMEMKYMNQVIDETLRKYPPLSFITRECVKDYSVPETDLVLEKGTGVVISILGLHHNTDYYPDPEKFDPERFSEENKQQRTGFTYMPFGEGPRICIGLRFGMMQTKVGLALLLQNFKVSLNKRTAAPLELDPHSIILTSKSGIYLDVEKV